MSDRTVQADEAMLRLANQISEAMGQAMDAGMAPNVTAEVAVQAVAEVARAWCPDDFLKTLAKRVENRANFPRREPVIPQ